MKKSELEAKVREQEIEIAGLKAKLELLMKLVPGPAVAPVILPPVVAPQPMLPIVQPWKENWPGAIPWDYSSITVTCGANQNISGTMS